ncbi:MAG: hypothetical protein ACJA0Q_001097 [Saprospiraceae bacterium]|jgi:hypothetical protein
MYCVLFLAKTKSKLVVFEVPGLIFATFYQEKGGSTPDREESMQWKIAELGPRQALRR